MRKSLGLHKPHFLICEVHIVNAHFIVCCEQSDNDMQQTLDPLSPLWGRKEKQKLVCMWVWSPGGFSGCGGSGIGQFRGLSTIFGFPTL